MRPDRNFATTLSGLIAVSLLAVSTPASAGFLTGQTLKRYLDDAEAGNSFAERTIAMGYIAGVADFADGSAVCLSRPLDGNDAMRLVHRWLRAHPDRLSDNAADLVRGALSEAYPCGRVPGAASDRQ